MPRGRPRLSLIEAALLLCLIGIVLAVFVPSFLRRVRTNKISEAAELLQEMSARTSAYYATSWSSQKRNCLPPEAGPTPDVPTTEAADVDFYSKEESGHSSWQALGFQPERPVRYSYSYEPSRHGCGLASFGDPTTVVLRAEGDLDGDGVRSTFERSATLRPDGSIEPETLHVHQRIE